MTARELGGTGIKLIGAFFAVSGVIRLFALAVTTAMPPVEGLPSAGTIIRINALVILGELAIAAALVFRGDWLASHLFSESRVAIANFSRRDVLIVGLALLGVSSIAEAAPEILQFIGRAIWFAEGSRQAQFLPSMERSWQPLVRATLELVVGGAMVLKAGRFGSALDGRYRSESERRQRAD